MELQELEKDFSNLKEKIVATVTFLEDEMGKLKLVAPKVLPRGTARTLDELKLSTRAWRRLYDQNIHNLADLVASKPHSLIRSKNMGKVTFNEICDVVKSEGIEYFKGYGKGHFAWVTPEHGKIDIEDANGKALSVEPSESTVIVRDGNYRCMTFSRANLHQMLNAIDSQ